MKRKRLQHLIALAGAAAWVGTGVPAHGEDRPAVSAPGADAAAPAPPAPSLPSAAASAPEEATVLPGRVSLELIDLPVEEIARRLGAALGSEVRLEGNTARRGTLKLENATVREALDRAATAMSGSWKRVYSFTKGGGLKLPPPVPTGLTVSLNLSDASCQTAAIIAAKAAGATVEGAADLTGRVTLVAKDLPVEAVMERIATEAGATWRAIYVFKLDAAVPVPPRDNKDLPEVPDPLNDDPSIPVYERNRGVMGPRGRRRFHSMPKERRTRYNTLGRYGAKMPSVPPPDVEKLERLSRLGSFAGIFSLDDAQKRAEQIRLFRQALELQSRRLEAFRPEQRHVATRLTRNQLQSILDDALALDDKQKEEVAPILDYLKDRLKELDALLGETQTR